MKKIDVIRIFGGVSRTADALGLTPAAVSQWGAIVPPLRQYQIREKLRARALAKRGKRRAK